jgi:hypothetical protein
MLFAASVLCCNEPADHVSGDFKQAGALVVLPIPYLALRRPGAVLQFQEALNSIP